jgi:cytochrome b
MPTTSIRAWDLPTRLFHWTLAGLFLGAFAVAHLADEHRPTFAIHMLLGLILLAAIAFRLVWGFVGSRHARFASFLHSPAALAGYLKEALAGRDRPTVGHNPGASWAIYGMLLLPLALVTTGILAQPRRELFEDLHGALGWVMMAAVAAHLAGIAWHTFRHRENIALAMITGERRGEPADAIGSARPLAAVVFVALLAGWAALVLWGHDPVAKVVRIAGTGVTIPVAEKPPEGDRHGQRRHGEQRRRGHDDD